MNDTGRGGDGRRPGLAFALDPARTAHVFSPAELAELGRHCHILDPSPIRDFRASAGVLARTEILVTGWGCPPIDAAVLAVAPQLRLIAHAAGSVKPFLGPEVLAAGIAVTNAAEANAIPVAEFTLAAILLANKRVLAFREAYRTARAALPGTRFADLSVGNRGRTVGIVGASRIGRRVIALLAPFDLRVVLHDPYVDEAGAAALGVPLVSLDALMATSDVVSLHAPALPETRHMIDARRLALLRDGATLVNTARGSLVDQAALERELLSGRISAVIDVTVPEVLPAASALYDLPNVLLTPHIAGALGSERERLGAMAVAEVARFVRGEPLRHAVTAETFERQA